jgi:hypothetical protein
MKDSTSGEQKGGGAKINPRPLVMAYGDNTREYRCSYCGAIVVPPDGTGAAISCHAADLSRQEKPPGLLAGGHVSQRETQMRGHGRPNQALEPTPLPVASLFFISYPRVLKPRPQRRG